MNNQFKIIKNPAGSTRKVWCGASIVITYSKTLKRLKLSKKLKLSKPSKRLRSKNFFTKAGHPIGWPAFFVHFHP